MTQCNIPEATRYDPEWRSVEERELLKTQLRLRDERIRELQEHLTSISDRVRDGHTVWIDYKCGRRLYLKAYTTEPSQVPPTEYVPNTID